MLIQVALPVPLYQVFDYLIPENISKPQIGSRVKVPFGSRQLIGIVIAHIEQSHISQEKLKYIKDLIDDQAIVEHTLLNFAIWLANYYHYPLGDVLAVMLPTLIRQGKALEHQQLCWRMVQPLIEHDFICEFQQQQFALLLTHAQPEIADDDLTLFGIDRDFLLEMLDQGLVEQVFRSSVKQAPVLVNETVLVLNEQQQAAVDQIIQSYQAQRYQGFLLNGVTGSGKTEVYLQAMQPVLQDGKQVLILVPEIGLTPQTYQRFSSRFQTKILMLHSGLSDKARLIGWQQCQQGTAKIVIGTRSTLLYPFANLGLIIVDESHDLSYKQQDTLRYHAADVALYRGYQLQCPVVLGTATPSLESLYLLQQGKLKELLLTNRAGNAKNATIRLFDTRMQKRQFGLAKSLLQEIAKTLEKQQQVLIFVNRRGYAPILLCESCGWQADCSRCDAHMTVHLNPVKQLKCHHCDWQQYIPKICPNCGGEDLDPVGVGTARMVEGLQSLFADTAVIQIDKDTTQRKNSWEKIYQQVAENERAILVGTQMIAKGHHFPNVTLVVIANADRGFLSSNFRSPEHTAQLIMQVAGRAGRADKRGQVLIQTTQPDHPYLITLIRYGYLTLAKQLLVERQLLNLPPFQYASLIWVESKTLAKNHQLLQDILSMLPNRSHLISLGISVSGVIDAPMTKKNNRFRSQLLILAKNRQNLHQLLNTYWRSILALPSAKYSKLILEIDPLGWD